MSERTFGLGDHGMGCGVLCDRLHNGADDPACTCFREAMATNWVINPDCPIHSQDDTTPCRDCGQSYYERMGSYWLTDDALWAAVVGDTTFVLCPGCFARRAEQQGIPIHFEAVRGV